MARSYSTQEMVGAGLLCLVVQIMLSTLPSVTVSIPTALPEAAEDCMEIEDGETVEEEEYRSCTNSCMPLRYDYSYLP